MFDRLDDTIVAISSPPGVSPRGIVRLSGPRAMELADTVFEGPERPLRDQTTGWQRSSGRVRIDRTARVPGEAYVFRAPASYTRQDLVELHLPGVPAVLAMVLELLTGAGARPAEPGEFTARAFFAGAMDLTEVEGVAAVIHAQNDAQLRASEALLHGELNRQCTRCRDELADLLALIEARIDFAEEPEDFVSTQKIAETLDRIAQPLGRLCRDAPAAERFEVLPTVLIAGRPNVGKSTLFNRLTGMDRAIQSATAGTTRDLICAPLTLAGGEVLLVDSAGLREDAATEEPSPADDPDRLAERASRQAIERADAVLLVVDATEPFSAADDPLFGQLQGRAVTIVANKIDLMTPAERSSRQVQTGFKPEVLAISALSGEGLDDLRRAIDRMLFAGQRSHETPLLALSNRQREAASEACEALQRGRKLCAESAANEEPIELMAIEVRAAMNALSLLSGQVVTEALLGRIFERFCVGK